jgi:hypothetical protein
MVFGSDDDSMPVSAVQVSGCMRAANILNVGTHQRRLF